MIDFACFSMSHRKPDQKFKYHDLNDLYKDVKTFCNSGKIVPISIQQVGDSEVVVWYRNLQYEM